MDIEADRYSRCRIGTPPKRYATKSLPLDDARFRGGRVLETATESVNLPSWTEESR